jgi:6-pyruvoyltetrahydropterin/6-carboxytetrahydropterin synthase
LIDLTRRYRFPAAHVLAHPSLSAAENFRIYGKCANPGGHGHDYGLEVTVRGAIDPRSGQVADRDALDAVVEERVLERFSHRMLNDDPAFGERVPTAENIAAVVHAELEAPVEERCGARLLRVRLHETRKNSFVYGDVT